MDCTAPVRVLGLKSVVEVPSATTHLLNATDCRGRTPLHIAAMEGHQTIIQLLVNVQGIDLDLTDFYRKTALSYAAERGHYFIVSILQVLVGIKLDSIDQHDRTPFSYAVGCGGKNIKKLLLSQDNIDVNGKGWNNERKLLHAVL